MKQQCPSHGFWTGLRHAFAVPEDPPLSEEEHRWLDLIAEKVVRRRLTAPAVFLLQSAKPLNYVGSQVLVFFRPIISVVFPPEKCDQAADLLSRRQSIEALLQKIEEHDAAESARAGGAQDPPPSPRDRDATA